MNQSKLHLLTDMFVAYFNTQIEQITILPASGSYREYARLSGGGKTALGAYNADKSENIAFISFSEHFKSLGLNVPAIYTQDLNNDVYLLEDLGDVALFDFLSENKTDYDFPDVLIDMYKKTIEALVPFQINGIKNLDLNLCYPRKEFDQQSMQWDLQYFKYYFLKLAKIPFSEQKLEKDFKLLIDYLLQAEQDFFLYRDFQSRNIMIHNNEPWFIDYQGGRKGALQYDLASLLYDSKADIPANVRDVLYNHYIETLKKYKQVNEEQFKKHYDGYVYIRLMQAMGAYGFRGFYEKKEHFLKSIPYALNNISHLLHTCPLPIDTPELTAVLTELTHNEKLLKINTLTVNVNSFSYRRGIPYDMSGNGGGFVFDCRSIHNPGRYEQYKNLTGKDAEVIKFLEDDGEAKEFLNSVIALVSKSIETYSLRNFKHLMINFGCTGGQHRSVYCAEQLSAYIKSKYNVNLNLKHIEQDIKAGI